MLSPANASEFPASLLDIIKARAGEKNLKHLNPTSSPVYSNHQLENDKELYLSLISLCLVQTANTTRLSFQINLYIDITMAVFA